MIIDKEVSIKFLGKVIDLLLSKTLTRAVGSILL